MTVQFVDIAGSQMVVLTRAEFDRLAEAAEHFSDIAAAAEAQKRRENGEEYFPAEIAKRLVAGENSLKVWRKYRGFSQQGLAEAVGRNGSFIAKLEKDKNEGGIKLWQQLAKVLNVDLEDLVPPLD